MGPLPVALPPGRQAQGMTIRFPSLSFPTLSEVCRLRGERGRRMERRREPCHGDATFVWSSDKGSRLSALSCAGVSVKAARRAVLAGLRRGEEAVEFGEESLFFFLTDDDGVHAQAEGFGDSGDAVHAGLVEASVL